MITGEFLLLCDPILLESTYSVGFECRRECLVAYFVLCRPKNSKFFNIG